MQGFNRYIPPDYDPKKSSTLNAHQGKKHALGVRAKDIDKGILVVRFELPFNIWCGSCNAHIGAGVRYNSQKRKVGNYFSTPIYAFRCKCHLCDGWFEIRTDPKNAAYVVHEGARKKDEDWNPEENGGYAVHDTEAPSASEPPSDPFAHVEKTIDQQSWAKRGTSRLTELTRASERISGDPYVVSSALRRKFRKEKKVLLGKQGRDESLKEKFGLDQELDLGEEVERGKEIWQVLRERKGLPVDDPSGSGSGGESSRAVRGTPVPTPRGGIGINVKGKGKIDNSPNLAQVLRQSTNKKYDPFSITTDTPAASPSSLAHSLIGGGAIKTKGRIKDPIAMSMLAGVKKAEMSESESGKAVTATTLVSETGLGVGMLAGYGSD